jgi:hypothetical protein
MSARGAYTIADLLFVVLDTTLQTLTSTRIRISRGGIPPMDFKPSHFRMVFRITMF